ncbi:unnamed protein product [Euphydryas editha]|uniref:Uncharacterized protein n=1 Tax=Euphydryas editha TaxID=104508 RepID=A0AAU9UGR0_EUPED|nr:unnamed protein product [Euphydryas editha]
MGKRKRDVSENYELIAYKIKKLEQKLMRTRRRDRQRTPLSRRLSESTSDSSRSSSSSNTSSSSSSRSGRGQAGTTDRELPPETLCIEGVPISSRNATTAAATAATPLPSTSAGVASEYPPERIISLPGTSAVATSRENNEQLSATEPAGILDDELLSILGEDPSLVRSYGEDIQLDLASRLQHIARTGLPKEVRKELMDKYLPPANCTLIEAPILNPEVVAAVSEAVLKRDKGMELRQKQRTSAISCVAKALTLLMSSEPRNTVLIQILMDAIKLMCDSQNTESTIRRNFVLNTLKKDLKDQLQATKIDKLLFSENLADTLKAAKAISKSGADLKETPSKQQSTKTKQPQKYLNWRGPPQNHRQKGTQRTKQPADKGRTDRPSKPPSRPSKYRSNNRR